MSESPAPAMILAESVSDEAVQTSELGARSLTAAVYQRLREDIITSRLQQNEKLIMARLQERFSVSLSVIREALSRLVADGLVLAEAQRGFRVSPVSRQDLIDVTRTRIRIEGLALAMAIARGDEQWLDSLRAIHGAMSDVDRHAQTELWTSIHGEFHRALLVPCGSVWLMRFRDLLFEQSERYRYLFARLVTAKQLPTDRDVDAEHLALLTAVCQRNPEGAAAALQTHFDETMQVVMAATVID